MIKVVISGPESSGKTSLGEKLGTSENVLLFPEIARKYLTNIDRPYVYSDLLKIAQHHNNYISNCYKNQVEELVLLDTYLLNLVIWSQLKFAKIDPQLERMWKSHQVDLYLLCKPDIPWEPDPLREDEFNRDGIYDVYLEKLKNSNQNFVVIQGDHEQRLKIAQAAIDSLKL